jgi:hypothetical protein
MPAMAVSLSTTDPIRMAEMMAMSICQCNFNFLICINPSIYVDEFMQAE